jgi:hypothetical protein
MIAVALAVIIGLVAVTCGIVAESNHADTLTFLGLMVKTTAAQIFLAGAICTWAMFASMWLLSVGIRRSKERGLELRLLRGVRRPGLPGAADSAMAASLSDLAGLTPSAGIADAMTDQAMSAPIPAHSAELPIAAHTMESADPTDPADPADPTDPTDPVDSVDSEPTIDFAELKGFNGFGHIIDDVGTGSTADHVRSVAEPGLTRHLGSGRFYRAEPRPNPVD